MRLRFLLERRVLPDRLHRPVHVL